LIKALFIELPPFERYGQDYLADNDYRNLQNFLLLSPKAGDVIAGTDGLRKLRFGDPSRGKGKRGGLRIIYYWYEIKLQFWLFTIYDKDEMSDLGQKERKALMDLLNKELGARK
jgi:mRNA-degrading endonuclease RelE of RelBE toxin-antitoxin system